MFRMWQEVLGSMVRASRVITYLRVLAFSLLMCTHLSFAESKPRARDMGIIPGILPPGLQNSITDIDGVRVGQRNCSRGSAGEYGRYCDRPRERQFASTETSSSSLRCKWTWKDDWVESSSRDGRN